jgi:hypothetical protein
MRLPLMGFARGHGGEVGSRVLARRLGALDLGKGLRVLVVAEVQLGQHARVQHTHDEDRFLINLPEIARASPVPAADTGAHLVASAATPRIFSEPFAASFELFEVASALLGALRAEGVGADLGQVVFGAAREAKASHELPRREAEPRLYAIKRSAFGDPALLAFVKSAAERGELGLAELLLLLERAEAGAHDLARVLVAPGCDGRGHEAIELGRQVDVAGGHGGS